MAIDIQHDQQDLQYDPIKDRLGAIAAGHPFLRRLFYGSLGVFFLRNWYVRRTIRRLLPDRSAAFRMLDAGTGFGQWVHYAARRYGRAEILAVDVKDAYLADARAFTQAMDYADRVTFEKADLTEFGLDEPVDFILSVDVMEHIEEDERVFANFFQMLKPGGVVVLNTPSDQGGSDVEEAGAEGFIGEHVRDGYNPAELAAKLGRAGLTVASIQYSYGTAGSAAWRMLIKWPMKLLNVSFLFLAVLPLYYLPVLPIATVLNAIDLSAANETGTGLHVVARRPEV